MTELLLGCGSRRNRILGPGTEPIPFQDLVTCDINPVHEPDVVWDLNRKPWPWDDATFDEVHAYEVLEHLGRGVGDEESFFEDFYECWRILKPNGLLCATCPGPGPWALGDPGHKRVIFPESLIFLSQKQYEEQVGTTPMSDYRYLWKGDFDWVWGEVANEGHAFILRAVK